MAQVLTKASQRVFINQTELRGVQDISIDSSLPFIHSDYAAMDRPAFFPVGPLKSSFNISTVMMSDDIFLPFTGDSSFNGYIVESTETAISQNISFTSGYLSSYSTQCRAGEMPQIDVKVDVFGNCGFLQASEASHLAAISQNTITSLQAKVPTFGSIAVNIGHFDSNRIMSYDLSLSIPRRADYCLGSKFPVRVVRSGPIEVSCNFAISAKDFSAFNTRNFPQSIKRGAMSISAYDVRTDTLITSYSFADMVLVSQVNNSNVGEPSSFKLGYVGYLY